MKKVCGKCTWEGCFSYFIKNLCLMCNKTEKKKDKFIEDSKIYFRYMDAARRIT
jgi:hypothetical protein